VKIIAIEEHWNSISIRHALDRLQGGTRDESVAFNTMGDNQARLEDIGQGRVEAMDAAGIDVSILSVVTPATQALPAREAVALARDANDEATSAVRAYPARFRAFATLPTSDPQAAAAELERCTSNAGYRTTSRPTSTSPAAGCCRSACCVTPSTSPPSQWFSNSAMMSFRPVPARSI